MSERTFKNVQQIEDKIAEFKQYIIDNDVPPTLERLACICDCDKDTISAYKSWDYDGTDESGSDVDESLKQNYRYSLPLKKVVQRIESTKVERLNAWKGSTVGIIFDLKNNHKWKDKQDIEMSWNIWLNKIMEDIIQ